MEDLREGFNEIKALLAETVRLDAERARLEDERARRADERARLEDERARRADERTRLEDERARQADERARQADERARQADERARQADERLEKFDKSLDKLKEQVGGIGNNQGFMAEEFFQKAFAVTKTFAGIKFDRMISNMNTREKESCEFDIVLINCDSVAIIEVKNRIHPDFVETLTTKKLDLFRRFFPQYATCKTYLGVAGLSFDKAVEDKAKEHGVVVVRQRGETVEMFTEGMKVY